MNYTVKHRSVSDAPQSSATTDHIDKELNHYDEHLRDVRQFFASQLDALYDPSAFANAPQAVAIRFRLQWQNS